MNFFLSVTEKYLLITAVRQSDSVIHTYGYIYIYTHILFHVLFSIMVYHRNLNIVSCAMP